MRHLFSLLLALMALACLVIAGWLCIEGKPGWGWFLFAAALLSPSVTITSRD